METTVSWESTCVSLAPLHSKRLKECIFFPTPSTKCRQERRGSEWRPIHSGPVSRLWEKQRCRCGQSQSLSVWEVLACSHDPQSCSCRECRLWVELLSQHKADVNLHHSEKMPAIQSCSCCSFNQNDPGHETLKCLFFTVLETEPRALWTLSAH